MERARNAAVRATCVAIALWFAWLFVHNHGGRALFTDGLWAWLGEGGAMLVIVAMVLGALVARAGWPLGRAIMRPSGASFAGAAFALALVTGICAHYLIHKGVPEVPDEFGYLHQARTFAQGWLAAPSPPLEEFHYVSWGIHDHGAWYAVFPPAYGVLLGLGVRLGVGALVNPLLGALLALVIFELGKETLGGDGPAARLAVVLYLASWFRLMHAGSYMAHPTAALFTGLTVLGAIRGIFLRKDPPFARVWAITAGLSLAALAATRPLNAAIVAAALLPPTVVAVARERRHGLMRLGRAVVAMVPVLLAYFAYNRALTGHALVAPQERYMALKEEQKDCFRLGFGRGVGECPLTQNTHFKGGGYSVDDARKNTGKRLSSFASDLFGVAPLACLPILGLLGGALAPAREARRRALLGILVFATVLGYALFFYHGVVYGARFYYESLPFAALLAAAALRDGFQWVEAMRPGRGRGRLRRLRAAAAWALPVALIVALRAAWPGVEASAGKRARTDDGALLRILAAPELRDAVVFVDSQVVPAAMTSDPIHLDHDHPLVVRDLGDAANAGFLRAHPGLRPMRLVGHRLVALHYPPDAPVRHEGGAKYPLEVAVGGFGDRVSAAAVHAPQLSADDALRFRARQPGAWFGIPIWVPPADAGHLIVHVETVAHPDGPAVGVAVDGTALSPWLDTNGKGTMAGFDLPAELGPGRHWLTFRIRDAAHGETRTFLLDYVELRRR